MKKIMITGATGSIGRNLVQHLIARGEEVIIFTRYLESARNKIVNASRYVKWVYDCMDVWMYELNGADAVVHLAGATGMVEGYVPKGVWVQLPPSAPHPSMLMSADVFIHSER